MIPRPHLLGCYLLTLLAMAWLVHAVAQQAPVRVVVEGARAKFEPATVRLRVRVEPNPDNRLLIVVAVADGFLVRRSDEQLEGDRAPITRWIDWRRLDAGEYVVVAQLGLASGETKQDRTVLSVVSRGF